MTFIDGERRRSHRRGALVFPPPGLGSPEPQAGDVILLTGSFDEATLSAQLAAFPNNGQAGFARVAPGRDGSGACVQLQYTPATPGPFFTWSFAAQPDLYARWYFRISPRWRPYSGITGSGFKWFLTKRDDGVPRYTHGVSELTGGPPGFENVGYEFTTHDQSSTQQFDPTCQNISKAIRFDTVNDGNWHKCTYHIKASAPAYEQIWIDDVRVLDTRDGQPGIPAGGYDHLAQGITSCALGELVVDGIPTDKTTGSTTLAATTNGYTRSAGSFLVDGIETGGVVTPSGFASNPVSRVTSVSALSITVADARGAEAAAAGRTLLETFSGTIDYDDLLCWRPA